MTEDIVLHTEVADEAREDVVEETDHGHDEEAFRYIAGYVQKKVKEKFPGLIIPEGEKCANKWIENLSRGNLTIPNMDVLEICQDLNKDFEAFHGEFIDMSPNPLERLLKEVLAKQEKNDIYEYICEIFLKVRFFNRIKHLNVKLKCNESADKIRKKTQEMQHMY